MSLNLVQNFSFETGLAPWQTGGPVSSLTTPTAFEGSNVAQMGPLVVITPGNAVLSQAFPIDSTAVNMRLSYAIQTIVESINGDFQTRIRYQRGAVDGYSIIQEDVLETIQGGALIPGEWDTHVVTSLAIPAEAVQARLRFVLLNGLLGSGPVLIDEVVITAED